MMRQIFSFGFGFFLLTLLPAFEACAVELPIRKPGLWEMKMVSTAGSPSPGVALQQCTDESTDKAMSMSVSPTSNEDCPKQDIQKTATGYVVDAVCSMSGISMTSHFEITGDFNSAYTMKTTSHSQHSASGVPHDITMTMEAKWLGACKPDQKPGDIVMPGGFKINFKDAEKLKGLLPR